MRGFWFGFQPQVVQPLIHSVVFELSYPQIAELFCLLKSQHASLLIDGQCLSTADPKEEGAVKIVIEPRFISSIIRSVSQAMLYSSTSNRRVLANRCQSGEIVRIIRGSYLPSSALRSACHQGLVNGQFMVLIARALAAIHRRPYLVLDSRLSLLIYGYTHDVDWVERKIFVPENGHEADQAKYFRVAEIVKQRLNLRVRKFKSVKEIKKDGYLYRVFDVVNKAYAPLFGFSEINRAQVDKYANQYLQFLDLRLLTVIENAEGEPVAMGVGIGSLSHALQKAKGKLFPFGWWHLLKAIYFKRSEIIDLLLVAVLPEYQSKGVNALLFADIIPIAKEMGFKWAESHPQLETNNKSQDQWKHLDQVVHKRRRCYRKPMGTTTAPDPA